MATQAEMIAALQKQVTDLVSTITDQTKVIADLQTKISVVETKVIPEKIIKAITFEYEGETIKVRARVQYKNGPTVEEQWEDFTEKFTDETKKEILNVA